MQIIKWNDPPRMIANLTIPALISSLVVLPFVILELMNRPGLQWRFPFALFGMMWILPFLFLLILIPIARNLFAEKGGWPKPFILVPRVVFLLFIAWFWVSLVVDQMPCFLGVPNCD